MGAAGPMGTGTNTAVQMRRPMPTTIEPPVLTGARVCGQEREGGKERRAGDTHVWTATGHERPVFLDEHGRRRRWVLAGGALTGGVSALWLGGLLAGAIGFASLPSPYAQHGDRVGRQANVPRSAREHAVGGRDVEARVSGRPVRLPVVLRGRKLPLGESS
jgi:hypothetical protein